MKITLSWVAPLAAATALLLAEADRAGAIVYDLTTVANGGSGTTSASDGIAQYKVFTPGATGSGNFEAYVQMSPSQPTSSCIVGGIDCEKAYNTTANNVFDNKNDDPHNYTILLSDIGTVTIGGVTYYEFLLDLNQQKDEGSELISLDDLQIFLSSSPNQSVTTFSASGQLALASAQLIYRLDDGSDDTFLLDATAGTAGSGDGDLLVRIPASAFSTYSATYPWVYVYSQFGAYTDTSASPRNFQVNDGFEEWGRCVDKVRGVTSPAPCEGNGGGGGTTQVPAPDTLGLLGIGLMAAAGFGSTWGIRRRR
jgi:hypothetical protein